MCSFSVSTFQLNRIEVMFDFKLWNERKKTVKFTQNREEKIEKKKVAYVYGAKKQHHNYVTEKTEYERLRN